MNTERSKAEYRGPTQSLFLLIKLVIVELNSLSPMSCIAKKSMSAFSMAIMAFCKTASPFFVSLIIFALVSVSCSCLVKKPFSYNIRNTLETIILSALLWFAIST